MSYIQTATGRIDPSALGFTLMHEHILWDQSCYHEPVDETDPENAFLLRKICIDDLGLIRQPLRIPAEGLSRLRQGQAPVRPHKEGKAEPGFQLVDLVHHRRRREIEPGRRLVHAAALSHREKGFNCFV